MSGQEHLPMSRNHHGAMTFSKSLCDSVCPQHVQEFSMKTIHTLAATLDMNHQTMEVMNNLCPR